MAMDLRIGDLLNGSGPQRVEEITVVNLKKPVPVYNLVLASAVSYRVGMAKVLVAAVNKPFLKPGLDPPADPDKPTKAERNGLLNGISTAPLQSR